MSWWNQFLQQARTVCHFSGQRRTYTDWAGTFAGGYLCGWPGWRLCHGCSTPQLLQGEHFHQR
jgi:hypothetical protein